MTAVAPWFGFLPIVLDKLPASPVKNMVFRLLQALNWLDIIVTLNWINLDFELLSLIFQKNPEMVETGR